MHSMHQHILLASVLAPSTLSGCQALKEVAQSLTETDAVTGAPTLNAASLQEEIHAGHRLEKSLLNQLRPPQSTALSMSLTPR